MYIHYLIESICAYLIYLIFYSTKWAHTQQHLQMDGCQIFQNEQSQHRTAGQAVVVLPVYAYCLPVSQNLQQFCFLLSQTLLRKIASTKSNHAAWQPIKFVLLVSIPAPPKLLAWSNTTTSGDICWANIHLNYQGKKHRAFNRGLPSKILSKACAYYILSSIYTCSIESQTIKISHHARTRQHCTQAKLGRNIHTTASVNLDARTCKLKIATKSTYGSEDAMVVSVLPGMVVSMLLGIKTLKPSIAVDMIIEGICGCQCSSFKSLWPCSYKQMP